ncbi:MAG: hypothetical protein ACE5PO_07435 [Candidatus Bathyarchaeia archaeon]
MEITVYCPDCEGTVKVESYDDLQEGEILACPDCGLEVALYKTRRRFYAALEKGQLAIPKEHISENIHQRKLPRRLVSEFRYFDRRNPGSTVGYRQDISSRGSTRRIYLIEARKVME